MLSCVGPELPFVGILLTSERVERRLAAVLAADVAGYTLVRRGSHAIEELPKLFSALGIDDKAIARTPPLVL